jgi:hypothetical protein
MAQLGAAGNDVVHLGGESRFCGDKETEFANFLKYASPGPSAFTSVVSAFPPASVRAQKTIRAPAATKTRTQPSPMPLLPPVMITTLSG